MLMLKTAQSIAIEVGKILQPHCDRLNIAGSVRRGKQEVHDIELVCLPKRTQVIKNDLFETHVGGFVVDPKFGIAVESLGKILKGKYDGRMMQVEVHNPHGGQRTIVVDLFMPQAHDYYRIFAIRTGSASYSQNTIANGWLKKGWCGTNQGLRLQSESKKITDNKSGKIHWECFTENPTRPPGWNSEKEFFDFLEVPYIVPRLRSV